VLTANEIDINNENSIMFTPAGELYLGITSGNKQQKLSSKAGRCIAVKPAELLTAGLVAFVSVVKEMMDIMGGVTLLYTTDGSFQWGRAGQICFHIRVSSGRSQTVAGAESISTSCKCIDKCTYEAQGADGKQQHRRSAVLNNARHAYTPAHMSLRCGPLPRYQQRPCCRRERDKKTRARSMKKEQ